MNIDELCLKYGTDKSSELHNYSSKYEKYFFPLKDKALRILEIGIQRGFSLRTWEEYFINSHIYGIDITNCSAMDTQRIKTFRCDQSNVVGLTNINNDYGPFDIIIDDGSHISSHMVTSFNHLFPLLSNGGLYVIEDLHCCYWPDFSGGNTQMMDRLKSLLDDINARGKCGLAERSNIEKDWVCKDQKFGALNWWEDNVEYIHQYRGITFIKKY